MAEQVFANNFNTTLAADINDTVGSLELADATGAPTIGGGSGDWFMLHLVDDDGTYEIVKVTARSSTTCTIVRGQEGTSAQAHTLSPTTIISCRLTKGTLEELQDNTDAAQADATQAISDAAAAQSTADTADGKADANIILLGALKSMANQDASLVDIDGGAIDGTTIGVNKRREGHFTSLEATVAPLGDYDVPNMLYTENRYFKILSGLSEIASNETIKANARTNLGLRELAIKDEADVVMAAEKSVYVNHSGYLPTVSGVWINYLTFNEDADNDFGPTGSGATNEWTALDGLPTDTNWIELRFAVDLYRPAGSPAQAGYLRIWAAKGAQQPVVGAGDHSCLVCATGISLPEGENNRYSVTTTKIPVDGNRIFTLRHSGTAWNNLVSKCQIFLIGYGSNS